LSAILTIILSYFLQASSGTSGKLQYINHAGLQSSFLPPPHFSSLISFHLLSNWVVSTSSTSSSAVHCHTVSRSSKLFHCRQSRYHLTAGQTLIFNCKLPFLKSFLVRPAWLCTIGISRASPRVCYAKPSAPSLSTCCHHNNTHAPPLLLLIASRCLCLCTSPTPPPLLFYISSTALSQAPCAHFYLRCFLYVCLLTRCHQRYLCASWQTVAALAFYSTAKQS
jgi:hypothetical protein